MNDVREIVTRAILAKGRKKFKLKETVLVNADISSVLGCWIINHNFETELNNKEVVIKENVWIGINVNIAGGVVIEENSVIGMGTTVAKHIPAGSIFAGGRFLSEREEKTHKYDLLEVRAMYHPIHYLKFNKKIKKIKKDVITFDEIKKVYDDYDTYILTYRWCENNNYIADWKNEKIKKAE